MSANPTITVLMPAYNVAAYIGEAIQSVLNQHFADFELVVVDDGSDDATAAFVEAFNDERIRLIRQEHQGVATALNNGLAQARGSYIARFDADDICLPDRLSRQLEFLTANPEYILCGGNAEYIAAGGEHLFNFYCQSQTHQEIIQQLSKSCPFIHSAVMYKKEPVLKAGGYTVAALNFEDYLLWIQLSSYGKFFNLPEQMIKVRFNPGSVTIDEKWRGRRFRRLKAAVIRSRSIDTKEGNQLANIIRKQDKRRIKEGAYYALCGKKYLVDNYQPQRARTHLSKAIRIYPFRWDNYALYCLSFFPASFIGWLHRKQSYQTRHD